MNCIKSTTRTAIPAAESFNRSKEIILGLLAGQSKAFTAIYPTLRRVLEYMNFKTNSVLVYEGITSPEALLSHLFERGKFSPKYLTSDIVDIDKWVWTMATRELISLVRSKQKAAFVKSFKSYDVPASTDDQRTLLDKLGDKIEEEKKEVRISAKIKIQAIADAMEELPMDERFKAIFYGMVAGQDKKTIMQAFKNVVLSIGDGYDDDGKYSDNYDMVLHRGKKYLREHIPYRQMVYEMIASKEK